MDTDKKQTTKLVVISSLVWKFLERTGSQGIQLIVQILLARLLLPEDFGVIVITSVFITLANVFVQSGFNKALIQRKNADNIDFSSVLYLSLFVAFLLYVLLFFGAPFIATFYNNPQLILVLRVLSITMFFGAFNSIQVAYLEKNMMFKKQFISSFGAILISGIVGISAAYLDYGVWALVAQQLTNQILITIILWFVIKWRPQLVFSFKRVKVLFSFGWKILASSLLHSLYTELRTLIIGKLYNPGMVAYYNRGQQFPNLIVSNLNGSIQSVMLPTMSSLQENRSKVKTIMRRSIVTSSFLVFPVMVGFAVIAEPFIQIVLTDKWLPAVPFLQIFCISFALQPVQMTNLEVYNALGRSDIYLKLAVKKKIIGLIILAISIPFGVYAIAWGSVLSAIIATLINIHPNIKLLGYSYVDQWKDVMPSLFLSLFMGMLVYLLKFINLSSGELLLFQPLLGVIIYLLFAKLFKVESLSYLLRTFQEIISKKKRVTS